MAHVPRFYFPPGTINADTIPLPKEELHHALHVIRAKSNDAIILFDGQGREWQAHVSRIDRNSIDATIDATREETPNEPRLTIALARLSREKSMVAAVQRATELGTDRFLFFNATHSEPRRANADWWMRPVIESCKQCERLWFPEIIEIGDLTAALALADTNTYLSQAHAVQIHSLPDASNATVFIGPEGGFTDEEQVAIMGAGALSICLGPHILRSEVAVSAAAAILRAALDRQ